jgi:hypothetical protein
MSYFTKVVEAEIQNSGLNLESRNRSADRVHVTDNHLLQVTILDLMKELVRCRRKSI